MNHKRAFTLIELLVVIAIVGVLSGFIAVSMSGAVGAAKDAKRKADIDQVRKALLVYGIENGSYPTASCSSGSACPELTSALVPNYLPSIPVDPAGTYYAYNSAGTDFTLTSGLSSGSAYQYDSQTNSFITGDIINGVCGSKNGQYSGHVPTGTEACESGTVSGMTGTYSWTCAGSNGGTDSGTCSATFGYSACTLRNSNAAVQADACLAGEVQLGVSNFAGTSTCDYTNFGTNCNDKKTINVAGVSRTYSIRAISYCRDSTEYSCAYAVATDALGTNTYIGQNTTTHTLYQTVGWGTSGGWAIVLDGSSPLIAPWARFGCPDHGLLSCVGNNSVPAPCNYAYNSYNALCCVE